MAEFFGVVLGSKSNPPECDREGKLLFFATKQEAREWGKRKPSKFHVVPLDVETIMRQRGDLVGLALWEVVRVTDLGMSSIVEMTAKLISSIVDMTAKLDKILEQCPQLAEVSKTEDKGD